jgi:hypothetical protein
MRRGVRAAAALSLLLICAAALAAAQNSASAQTSAPTSVVIDWNAQANSARVPHVLAGPAPSLLTCVRGRMSRLNPAPLRRRWRQQRRGLSGVLRLAHLVVVRVVEPTHSVPRHFRYRAVITRGVLNADINATTAAKASTTAAGLGYLEQPLPSQARRRRVSACAACVHIVPPRNAESVARRAGGALHAAHPASREAAERAHAGPLAARRLRRACCRC